MPDFLSGFWSSYISIITLVSIIGVGVFLRMLSTRRFAPGEKPEITGHTWDEDLAEYNNPLPRWWMWLFYITIVFSLIYLALYPGLGNFAGYFKWTSGSQYNEEQAQAGAKYGPIFDKYLKEDIKTVAADPAARQMGEHLYLTYCSQCHGSDARGAKGFPDLTDKDWLYGGDPDSIQTTIADGRNGIMPPMGPALGEQGVKEVANYVLFLSGRKHDAALAEAGKAKFEVCAGCHMPDGKGNPAMGAPNLTDNIWLYGGSEKSIMESINNGRNGMMPPQKENLGDAKVHLLAAYVYALSHSGK